MAEKTKPPPEPEHSIYERHLVRAPGPGKYETAKYSDFHPSARGAYRWSFGGKNRVRRDDTTPGPDQYSHPRSSFGGTKWTMAARFHRRDKEDREEESKVGPDGKPKPVQPPVPVRTFIGQGPKFSMAGRTRPIRSDTTPDPTQYNPLQALKTITQRVPAYTMASKYRTIDRDPYYVPPEKKDGKAEVPPIVKSLVGAGGPKYSMSGRTRHPRDAPLPGPGAYDTARQTLDLVGKSGPKFSMSARVKKGIAYGNYGDEPRLRETQILPSLQVVQTH